MHEGCEGKVVADKEVQEEEEIHQHSVSSRGMVRIHGREGGWKEKGDN